MIYAVLKYVILHYKRCNLRGWNYITDIKFFFFTIEKVTWSTDAPINAAVIGTFDVIIGVFAFGHDSILAYAISAPLEFVV